MCTTMKISPSIFPKVILFGDSITQFSFSSDGCWGALVADLLQRKCDVVNRGFSGYNVRWCSFILPQLITKDVAKEIAAFTIFLGANDSNDYELNPRQHVPIQEYRDGLARMIKYLKSLGVSQEKIILITPPAFNVKEWGKECIKKGRPLSKNNITTGEYAKACVEVAKELGTPVVDLYSEMMKLSHWEQLLVDGLHLSASGSSMLFSLLKPLIEKLTKNIPMIYPAWDAVDVEDFRQSLIL